MKCQILFSGKNRKNNIILSSAENAQRVVKVKSSPIGGAAYKIVNVEHSSRQGVFFFQQLSPDRQAWANNVTPDQMLIRVCTVRHSSSSFRHIKNRQKNLFRSGQSCSKQP